MPRTHALFSPVLLLALAAVSGPLTGQEDADSAAVAPEKAAAIRTLLRLTRTADLFLAGFEQAAATQPLPPDVPPDFWDAFKTKVRERVPEFVELLVPVYDAELSLEQVNGLVQFYQSPLGQQFIDAQAALVSKTMKLGERWVMRIVGEVFMEMSRNPS